MPQNVPTRRPAAIVAVVLAALLCGGGAHAQDDVQDQTSPDSASPDSASQDSANKNSLPWYVPSHLKLQYAGNIGWLSAGAGYTYLDDVLETELFFGFVPAYTGSDRIATASLKQLVVPYEFDVGRHVRIAPLFVGGYASYTFGSDYYLFPPEHLEGWYGRQTALRFGPLVGGRMRLDIVPFGPIENLGMYWELNTNDLAINAYVNNPEFLNFYDILALGLGVQVGFR